MRKAARRWLHQMQKAPEDEATPFTRAVGDADAVYNTLAEIGAMLLDDAARVEDAQSTLAFERDGEALYFEHDDAVHQIQPAHIIKTQANALDQYESLLGVEAKLKDWWNRTQERPFPYTSLRGDILGRLSHLSDVASEATLTDVRADLYGDKRQAALAMYFDRSDDLDNADDALGRLATVDRILETHRARGHLVVAAARGTNDEWYLIGTRDDNTFFVWQLSQDPSHGFRVNSRELVEAVYEQEGVATIYDDNLTERVLSGHGRLSGTSRYHIHGDCCIRHRHDMDWIATSETKQDAHDDMEEKRRSVLRNIIDNMGLDEFIEIRRVSYDSHRFKVRTRGVDRQFDDREPFIRVVYNNVGLEQTFGSAEYVFEEADDTISVRRYADDLQSIVSRNIDLQFSQQWEDTDVPSEDDRAAAFKEDVSQETETITLELGETTVRCEHATRLDDWKGIVFPDGGEISVVDPYGGGQTVSVEAGQYSFTELPVNRA